MPQLEKCQKSKYLKHLPEDVKKRIEKDPSYFYDFVTNVVVNEKSHPIDESDLPLFGEKTFYEIGRPYYKVWPLIGAEFTHTSLRIAAEHLHFPYPVYEIRLPKSNLIPLYDYYKSVMVMGLTQEEIEEHSFFRQKNEIVRDIKKFDVKKVIFVFWDSATYPHQDMYDWAYLPLRPGHTLEECIDRLLDGRNSVTESNYTQKVVEVFPDFLDLMRIVIATTMFAIGEHEMVLPDIETPIIDRAKLGRGKRLKVNLEKLKKQHDREIAKCKGWRVGSEIDLPSPEYVGIYRKQTGETRELTYGHVRSGHLRWQPYGEERKERKLIYLAPTVVRPDLPLRQSHGYRIKDNIKRIK